MAQALQDRVEGDWDLAGRVVGACRVKPGAPPGVPVGLCGEASPWQAVLVERAVEGRGATGREALGAPPRPWTGLLGGVPRPWVVLTHGGPRAGDLCHERPVSAAAVLDPPTGRTPVALDEEGWTRVLHLFRQEAGAAARAGAWAVGVEAARGHLWHAAISPLLCGDEALSRRGQDRLVSLVADLARVHPRVLVSLAVEDGAPGGLYPALGVSVARRVCEAGAGLVVARTGSPYAHPRLAAADPRSPEEEGGALHAARWLRRALPSTCLVAVADGIRSLAVAQSAVAQACCDVVVASEPLVGSGPDP